LSIHRFNLDGSGLGRVLGTLEARILEAIWQEGPLTVREMAAALGPECHYKTILTVANRLVDKGLLLREPAGDRAPGASGPDDDVVGFVRPLLAHGVPHSSRPW
jgi:hypothetical protein